MNRTVEVIGLICLVIMQALHIVHDYLKFRAHKFDIESLKSEAQEIKRRHKEMEGKNDME